MSKLQFKYKKEGEQYRIVGKETDPEKLRADAQLVSQQIQDLQLKKTCIEDKLRELSLKFNTFFQPSQYAEGIYMYRSNDAVPIQNEDFVLVENNFNALLPMRQPIREAHQKRSLYGYFGYKEETRKDLQNLEEIEKLGELFGLKISNLNKLKQHLKMIFCYLEYQELPEEVKKMYSPEFLAMMEL